MYKISKIKKVKSPPKPKMEIVIDNGIFDCFFFLLEKLGLYKQKERIQLENPHANVRYSFECSTKKFND